MAKSKNLTTPKLGAGAPSGLARPGWSNPSSAKAGDMGSVNGKVSRPDASGMSGDAKPKTASGAKGVARPGGGEKAGS